MRTAKCKCGEIQAWGEMPPCAICEKCGTAPGYVNAEKPAPHRFSKKFDQNTGKPFNFCMVCGRKEEVLFEPKCSGCGHSEHKFLCLHTIELSNGEHDVCDCQSFSPAEPKCADCGDADHVGRECGATKFAGDEIGVCRCYRPALHGGTR